MTLERLTRDYQKIDTDRSQHIMFKGPDGKDYATREGLAEAIKAHKRARLCLTARDINKFRVEIPYGSGEVQVCVGYKIKRVQDTKGVPIREEFPVYKSVRF